MNMKRMEHTYRPSGGHYIDEIIRQYQSHEEDDWGTREHHYLGWRFKRFLAIPWKKTRRNSLRYDIKRWRMLRSKAVWIWIKLFISCSYNVKIYVLSWTH